MLRSRSNVETLRKIYHNAERLLVDLTRAGVARFVAPAGDASRPGGLSPKQVTIARIATGQMLLGIKFVGDLWNQDILRALIFTAIWTANVKHLTIATSTAHQAIFPDELRRPVSVMAIANSLRLPYETVRRQANRLVADEFCRRIGRDGLVAPASAHEKFSRGAADTHRLVMAFLAELRSAGVQA